MRPESRASPPDPSVATIEIIGAPIDHGGAGSGQAAGPTALRDAGLAVIEGRMVFDRGDVEVPALPAGIVIDRGPDPESRRPEWESLQKVCMALRDLTRSSLQRGSIPLAIGGDHTLAAGSMSGVASGWCSRHDALAIEDAPPLGLLWFDAHVDLNTPDTSPSGNPHGMPAAALLGHHVAPLDVVVGEDGIFDPRRMVFLGGRDLDAGERARCSTDAKSPLPLLIESEAFRSDSPESIAERVIHRIAPDGGSFALSFDLDVLDPREAPGINLPVSGGPDLDQVMRILGCLADHGGCIAMDIVELDPSADLDGVTARIGVDVARRMFGSRPARSPHEG